jgi:hypothetical protein
MADRASCLATGERLSTQTRELARRQSGTNEVLLLWHPESDRVELAIRNLATGADCQVDVAPGDAIDAFNHPFAYAVECEDSDRRGGVETSITRVERYGT